MGKDQFFLSSRDVFRVELEGNLHNDLPDEKGLVFDQSLFIWEIIVEISTAS